jgi:putative aldouronate transport system substrate-binding protein
MNIKKTLSILLILVLVVSLAACKPQEPAAVEEPKPDTPSQKTEGDTENENDVEPTADYSEKITISICVTDAEKSGLTEKNEWFNEKFNVEWEYFPVTWGDWFEKVRAWVATDDTPDLLWWDMKLNHTGEFRAWAMQGAFREIPEDLSKWPELAKQRENLVSDDMVLTVDDKLYGWPAYRNNPDWLQNAYYPLFAYRRDWAQAVDMYKEGDMYTWDEVKAMIREVQSKDPGNNGEGNTFGMTSETWAFPGVFMEILGMAEDRSGYVKIDGSWTPYMATPEFLEELKFLAELYREGYIWKDQMVVGGSEGADNFYGGRAFMFLGNNSPSWFNGAFTKMLDNDMIESVEQIAPMVIFSPKDNESFWLTQTEDYWTVTNISHKVDDDKLNRILDMWNWLLTEEGRRFRVAGIPGKDYIDKEDGTMEILWEKDAEGNYKSPYVDMVFNEFTPPGLLRGPTETDRLEGFDAFEELHDFMQTSPNYKVHPLNWELNTFNGTEFSQWGSYNSDMTAKIKEIIASDDDVEEAWNAFLEEMLPKMQPVIDELNSQLK